MKYKVDIGGDCCSQPCYSGLDVCFYHASKVSIIGVEEEAKHTALLNHLRWAIKHLRPIDRGMRKRYDQILELLEKTG